MTEPDQSENLSGDNSVQLPKAGGATFSLKADEIPWATSGLDQPTIYCDIIRGSQVHGEVTKVALVEHRIDVTEDAIRAVHVATIVVPTSQLRGWGHCVGVGCRWCSRWRFDRTSIGGDQNE